MLLFTQIAGVLFLFAMAPFVYLKAKRNAAHVYFALSCVAIAVWVSFGALWNHQLSLGVLPEFASRSGMASASFCSAFLLLFSLNFPTPHPGYRRWWAVPVLGWAVLMALAAFTPWSVEALQLEGRTLTRTFGPLYTVFSVTNSLAFLAIIANVSLRYRHLKLKVERQKVKYLFFGLTAALLLVFVTMFLLPALGFAQLFFLGHLGALLFCGFTSYAIIRYKALDISTVIHKTIIWAITSALVFTLPFLAIRFNRFWLMRQDDLTLALLSAGFVLLFLGYYRKIQPRIDQWFQKHSYLLSQVLVSFSRELSYLKTLEELNQAIRRMLEQVLYASRVTMLLRDSQDRFVPLPGESLETYQPEAWHDFFRWLETRDEIAYVEEVQINPAVPAGLRPQAVAYFQTLGAELCVPLMYDRRLIGVVNLGKKTNLQDFKPGDFQLLSILRRDFSSSLVNAQLFEKVNRLNNQLTSFNETLAQKVAERTVDLEVAMEKLRKIDQLKTDFISMVSHELRTPMTAVKGALALALEAMAGGKPDPAAIHHLIQMGKNNIDRLIHLIDDLLDLAKLEENRSLPVRLQPTPLAGVLQAAVDALAPLWERKQIRIANRVAAQAWHVLGDQERLTQVVVNLLGNAIKFSPTARDITLDARRTDEGFIECSVTDQGPGIAAADHAKIFDKFGHAHQLTRRALESTGLGLSIAKKIIELHHGRIWVESLLGQGATFKFTLPAVDGSPATMPAPPESETREPHPKVS